MKSDALRVLREALARSPEQLRRYEVDAPGALRDLAPPRFVVTTGAGSSAGHARYLAALLAEHGVPARFLPLDAFPRQGHPNDALVVFSQGLSPNARLALENAEHWERVVAVTASAASSDPARRRALVSLAERGVRVLPALGVDEFGTLLRIEGPLGGYAAALGLAAALGAPVRFEAERIATAMEAALSRTHRQAKSLAARLGADTLLLLASGPYRDAVENLRLKCTEGLLRSVPPVSDAIELAHGPFQALFPGSATLLAFTRPDAPHERERLGRLRSMLDPGRHRLIPIEAALPGFEAVFEHEVWMNALVIEALEAAGSDPGDWPGRGLDGPIYDLAPHPPALAEQTWPELESALRAGRRLAVLPLGAIEQHGPHLPFATDSWIAAALAERFCARIPAAVRLPTLALGASSEHLDFPGTLSLAPETLVDVLGDIARSLARHGFEEIFCFSAHGGNLAALRSATATLEAAAAPARWIAVTDHRPLTKQLYALAEAAGVSAAAAGQHAGEIEASIVAALRPGALRRELLAPGRIEPDPGSGDLFYPSLRPNAPSGTVGDPRPADPTRAARYLDAWVDGLVSVYEGAKKHHQT
jgi:creatinine amidohydrolase